MAKDIIGGIVLIAFLFAVSVYLPIIGFFGALLLPLPVLFYRRKLGRSQSAIIPIVALLLLFWHVGGVSFDLLFLIELLLLGFVLGELFELNLTIEKTVALALLAVLAAGGAGILLESSLNQSDIFTLISHYIRKNLEFSLTLYQHMGLPEETIQQLQSRLDQIEYVLVRLLPSLWIAFMLVISWFTLLASRALFNATGIPFPDFGTLNEWKAPDALIWGGIGCGLLAFLPLGFLKFIGINGLIVLMPVYFFQGIAIISFFFQHKKLPKFLRLLIYGLIAAQQFLLLVVIAVGLFDMWVNFRKLNRATDG